MDWSIGQRREESAAEETATELEKPEAETEETVLESGIHYYYPKTFDLEKDKCSWTDAFDIATDNGGYLACINDSEEFDYILDQIHEEGKDDVRWWIGARRDTNGTGYFWVNEDNNPFGDPIQGSGAWCADIWGKNEPSLSHHYQCDTEPADEDCVILVKDGEWQFGDVPEKYLKHAFYYVFPGQNMLGYIVESEQPFDENQ